MMGNTPIFIFSAANIEKIFELYVIKRELFLKLVKILASHHLRMIPVKIRPDAIPKRLAEK